MNFHYERHSRLPARGLGNEVGDRSGYGCSSMRLTVLVPAIVILERNLQAGADKLSIFRFG
jgi:hypothetical protein